MMTWDDVPLGIREEMEATARKQSSYRTKVPSRMLAADWIWLYEAGKRARGRPPREEASALLQIEGICRKAREQRAKTTTPTAGGSSSDDNDD